RRVCVVGVGLIGGSLGMALRRAGYRVTGFGRNAARLQRAKRLGAIDDVASTERDAASDADIVVLCVPVDRIVPAARRLIPFAKRGAIFTDVGSAKADIARGMARELRGRRDLSFVGGHPLAGSERSGVDSARRDLFRGATCVITPTAPNAAVSAVRRMWTAAGARCLEMNPAEHDELLALTSHLPHLLAFSLFSLVSRVAGRDRRVRQLVAGSFRDMTRVAGSDPDVWSGIFSSNRSAVTAAFRAFSAAAEELNDVPARALRARLARLAREKKSW
ncbi:MAG: prephenate dehydrogenase/arogenate dehydrogenase family protein, partial [Elusimicrobia bacterium]|nr:prephenate dehydrogenase/arogenate dehydrogenase family protein [Elusimicrobiota bacterium]